MVHFLYPKTAIILQFLDPEIVEMDKKDSGSRNRWNGAISGSSLALATQRISWGRLVAWSLASKIVKPEQPNFAFDTVKIRHKIAEMGQK